MDSTRWERVQSLFHQALDLPTSETDAVRTWEDPAPDERGSEPAPNACCPCLNAPGEVLAPARPWRLASREEWWLPIHRAALRFRPRPSRRRSGFPPSWLAADSCGPALQAQYPAQATPCRSPRWYQWLRRR